MIKKLMALAGAAVLALTLTACTGTTEQLPTLDLGTSEASSTASGTESSASGVESGVESGTESNTESSQAEAEPVSDKDFEDSADGLCQYLEANRGVAGDPTTMAYETIGAVDGYRYRFTLNKSTVQVEVYQYDLDNLNEQAQTVLDDVKEKGSFTLLDKEIPAVLSDSGKYLMIYTDSSTSEENTAQKERVLELFQGFKAE